MKITPIRSWVIAKPAEKKKVSDGGIVLPPSSEPDGFYEALAVGPDVEHVKAGDTFFLPPAGKKRPITATGETLFAIQESEIAAIV